MRSCLADTLYKIALLGGSVSLLLHLATFIRVETFTRLDVLAPSAFYFKSLNTLIVGAVIFSLVTSAIEFRFSYFNLYQEWFSWLGKIFRVASGYERVGLVLLGFYTLWNLGNLLGLFGSTKGSAELSEIYKLRGLAAFFMWFYFAMALYYRSAPASFSRDQEIEKVAKSEKHTLSFTGWILFGTITGLLGGLLLSAFLILVPLQGDMSQTLFITSRVVPVTGVGGLIGGGILHLRRNGLS